MNDSSFKRELLWLDRDEPILPAIPNLLTNVIGARGNMTRLRQALAALYQGGKPSFAATALCDLIPWLLPVFRELAGLHLNLLGTERDIKAKVRPDGTIKGAREDNAAALRASRDETRKVLGAEPHERTAQAAIRVVTECQRRGKLLENIASTVIKR